MSDPIANTLRWSQTSSGTKNPLGQRKLINEAFDIMGAVTVFWQSRPLMRTSNYFLLGFEELRDSRYSQFLSCCCQPHWENRCKRERFLGFINNLLPWRPAAVTLPAILLTLINFFLLPVPTRVLRCCSLLLLMMLVVSSVLLWWCAASAGSSLLYCHRPHSRLVCGICAVFTTE